MIPLLAIYLPALLLALAIMDYGLYCAHQRRLLARQRCIRRIFTPRDFYAVMTSVRAFAEQLALSAEMIGWPKDRR